MTNSANGGSVSIDLSTYLPYLIHRLGAWTSPRRALRRSDRSIVRLREWRLLLVIAAHERLTGVDVCYLTAMDSGSTTRATQALIESGLIESTVCTDDRRRSWLTLTDHGCAAYHDLAAQRSTYNEQLLSVLTTEQQAQLLGLLATLQAKAEALYLDDERVSGQPGGC